MAMRLLLVCMFASCAIAQEPIQFEGMPAYRISNGKLTAIVLKHGGAIASVTLDQDPKHRNPLWDPIRMAREAGQGNTFGPSLGHFVCLDGFGGVSKEEAAAGYPFHGEAYLQNFAVGASAASLDMRAQLPMAHELVTRNLTALPARPVVEVRTTVTNELNFDRPMQWAEHATVGSPFLAPGETVIDMSAVKAKTRTYPAEEGGLPHRMASGEEFSWPMAPGREGGQVDMRLTPDKPNSGGHSTQLMDPSREWAWVTMLNTREHLLLGYCFRREEFPWVQSWENFPPSGKLARGLEFSTQPFDVPRRQTVTEGQLFGVPSYRWLPAKSSVTGQFYLFLTAVPEGWNKIDDVRFKKGVITIQSSGNSLTL